MYQKPMANPMTGVVPAKEEIVEHFDNFYEDVFNELSKFGKIIEMNVCDNEGDHLIGNVYVKYADEESATKAMLGLRGRYYASRPIIAELSPVTDFREARCRQFEMGECSRGGFCNFMHLKQPSRDVTKRLWYQYRYAVM